jgi:hypothetical protein
LSTGPTLLAELHIEGQFVLLEKGDSWVVPKGSRHTYKIIETFTAIEANSSPAEVHGRTNNHGVPPARLQKFTGRLSKRLLHGSDEA